MENDLNIELKPKKLLPSPAALTAETEQATEAAEDDDDDGNGNRCYSRDKLRSGILDCRNGHGSTGLCAWLANRAVTNIPVRVIHPSHSIQVCRLSPFGQHRSLVHTTATLLE
jgi:hypothetical protein